MNIGSYDLPPDTPLTGRERGAASSSEQVGENQPIIGMPILVQQGAVGPQLFADAIGAWAIEYMRGRVLLIPLWPFPPHQSRFQSLCPLLDSMDGLLLPAALPGSDWYQRWKERETQPGHQVWAYCWEITLAQLASAIGLPVLAIGQGAEQWNVALGGSSGPLIEREVKTVPPDQWDRQALRVRSGSKLATWMQQARVEQAEATGASWELPFMPEREVEWLAPGLRVCAQIATSVPAAFERADTAFGLGLLARLDWGVDQRPCQVIFEAFLAAARAFAQTRAHLSHWQTWRDQVAATLAKQAAASAPIAPLAPTPPGRRHRTGPLGSSEKTGTLRPHQPTLEELRALKRARAKQHSGTHPVIISS